MTRYKIDVVQRSHLVLLFHSGLLGEEAGCSISLMVLFFYSLLVLKRCSWFFHTAGIKKSLVYTGGHFSPPSVQKVWARTSCTDLYYQNQQIISTSDCQVSRSMLVRNGPNQKVDTR